MLLIKMLPPKTMHLHSPTKKPSYLPNSYFNKGISSKWFNFTKYE